ncbi:MAG: hypothetical protein HPM95_02775 [Alphaproteobacteria bacterium]|nr:hypothetical protein [Alphaproteobacteria bacterium]
MTSLARLFAALPRAGHAFGGWLLLLLALVIGYDVVGRKFSTPAPFACRTCNGICTARR